MACPPPSWEAVSDLHGFKAEIKRFHTLTPIKAEAQERRQAQVKDKEKVKSGAPTG